jgi:hypothetical protein
MTLAALLVGAMVTAGVGAAAADLSVDTNTLGVGSVAVTACQGAALTTAFETAYEGAITGYEVVAVTIDGLETGVECAFSEYRITLVDGSNIPLAEITGTPPASGSSIGADFSSSNVDVGEVFGVHIAFSGSSGDSDEQP